MGVLQLCGHRLCWSAYTHHWQPAASVEQNSGSPRASGPTNKSIVTATISFFSPPPPPPPPPTSPHDNHHPHSRRRRRRRRRIGTGLGEAEAADPSCPLADHVTDLEDAHAADLGPWRRGPTTAMTMRVGMCRLVRRRACTVLRRSFALRFALRSRMLSRAGDDRDYRSGHYNLAAFVMAESSYRHIFAWPCWYVHRHMRTREYETMCQDTCVLAFVGRVHVHRVLFTSHA